MLTIEQSSSRVPTLSYARRQHWLSKYRKALLENQTPAECAFYHILFTLGLRFIPQKGFMMPPRFIIVDFYLPKPHKLCIEIDGNSHKTIRQIRRDHFRDAYLRRRGYRVWRFSNNEVIAHGDEVARKIFNRVMHA